MKRTRLRPVSRKRQREATTRAEVRRRVLERDKDCFGKDRVPEVTCRGEHYVHEIAQRSICPGSHLNENLAVRICPAHDQWLEANIAEAHERGLLIHSWDVPGFIGFD